MHNGSGDTDDWIGQAVMTVQMRVRVDPRLCEAHALCIELAPEVFDLGDDVATCDETPDETLRQGVESAVAACPRQAISVVIGGTRDDTPLVVQPSSAPERT